MGDGRDLGANVLGLCTCMNSDVIGVTMAIGMDIELAPMRVNPSLDTNIWCLVCAFVCYPIWTIIYCPSLSVPDSFL